MLIVGLVACGESDRVAGSGSTALDDPMVACSVEVPPHALVDRVKGEWQMDGELVYRIRTGPDDVVLLERITNEDEAAVWRNEIRDPRWQDGKLLIDEFSFAIGAPGHPFLGKRVVSFMQPTDDPDVLLHGTLSVESLDNLPEDLLEPYEMRRAPPG